MVNLLAILLAAVLALFSTTTVAQPVTATLDRTERVRGETVILTLRVENQQGGVEMDLTPLERNFQVVATRTSSQLRSVNNRTESWIDYNLTLFPLNEGELEIPPLQIAGAVTPAMAITVLPKTQTSVVGQDLFMETVVNKDSIYVQEQLLFTIRLYYTINGIRNPLFTDLELADTVIQMIGTPNQYEKLVEGVRYGVYEKQYAIFPQRSGPLVIPDIMFRGEVTDGSSNYVFRNLNTRTITAFAEGFSIDVREKPTSYPQDATWLPASEVTIKENWDNDFTNVRVGDAVNRIVTVEAFGLDGAALPPFQVPAIDTVNVYPENPSIDRSYVDGNIVGRRIESNSMVMTATGTVRVPGITIPWFDIDTEEIKYATLEDMAIRVGPVRTGTAQDLLLQTDDQNVASLSIEDDTEPMSLLSTEAEMEGNITPPSTPLWILALAAALTALLFVIVYMTRRKPTTVLPVRKVYPAAAPMYRQDINPMSESQAFKELAKACEQNHLPALRLALIGWGRQYFADANLHSLDDLAQRTGNREIIELSLHIQQALYGQGATGAADLKADIQRLLALLTELRTVHKRAQATAIREQDFTLPPLYKA